MAGYRQIPEPKYDRDVARLVLYYKKAFKESAVKLYSIKYGIERQQAESLMNQIAFILQQLDDDTKKWCEEVIPKAYKDGQYRAIMSIEEASSLAEAASLASFSMLARDTVEALVNDTYADLLIATKNTETKIKQLVRSVVSDTMRVRAIEQLGRKTQRKDITGRLARQGLSKNLNSEGWVGIVDSAGRRWNLSTYAEMVVRTKLQQAHVEGIRVECLERKVDLAVVSSHGATDSCRYFEGMVISLNGVTPGFPTYAELWATKKVFHPNCQHSVNPVRDLSLLPKDVRDKAAESLKAAEQVLGKKYELPTPAPQPEPKTHRKPKEPAVPAAPKWINQKTVEEAEALAGKVYPHITWDFKDCHIDVINPTMETFVKLSNEFPMVNKRLGYFGSYAGKDNLFYDRSYKWKSNTFAHAFTNGRQIGINPAFYGNPEKFSNSLEFSVLQGFHPKGSEVYASVMTHEFGHQVWNWLGREFSLKALTPVTRANGFGCGFDILEKWQKANNTKAKGATISKYAMESKAEAWAEGFTCIYHDPETTNQIVKNQKALIDFFQDPNRKWYDKDEHRSLGFYPKSEREEILKELEKAEAEILEDLKKLGLPKNYTPNK